ncbi:mCG148033 [Mus musculus]|nr:mCG148033 [Mus musculus]
MSKSEHHKPNSPQSPNSHCFLSKHGAQCFCFVYTI